MKQSVQNHIHQGTFIPAHPLALDEEGMFDEKHQRALTNYYIDAGVGGLAVGVHTTQFEIRDAQHDLYETVLTLAVQEVQKRQMNHPFAMIAGVCGKTDQAVREAKLANHLGYQYGLLSFGGLEDYSEQSLIEHARKVGEKIDIFGFYLQPAVGGRKLSYQFWKEFAELDCVKAIKIAPFDRYDTVNVMRAVALSSRSEDIALYTGNDDQIVHDLLTTYQCKKDGQTIQKEIVGGLLGHWSVWTKASVDLFHRLKRSKESGNVSTDIYMTAQEVTDMNAAVFDAANQFKGSIAGINEVLRRQSLLRSNQCLSDHEVLSDGQLEEINRVYQMYPHLIDDEFVKRNLDSWL